MTATATAPDRSLQQRMDALARANAIRAARRAFKRTLKDAGNIEARYRVAEMVALDEPSPEFASMKVWDLLMAVPGLGRVKVNRLLGATQVSSSKTLAGLSYRQRQILSRTIADVAARNESYQAWSNGRDGLAPSSARSAETEQRAC